MSLFDRAGNLIIIGEDIGRHNALDKALGHCILRGIPMHDKIAYSTGRASYEMVVKTVRAATENRGAALAVDAGGLAATRAQCVASVRSTGKVILSGLHEETSTIPAADIIRREILAKGSFAYSPANFSQAVQLLKSGEDSERSLAMVSPDPNEQRLISSVPALADKRELARRGAPPGGCRVDMPAIAPYPRHRSRRPTARPAAR